MILTTFVKKAVNFAVFRVPYMAVHAVAPGPAEHVRTISGLLANIGVLYHRVRLMSETLEQLKAAQEDLPRMRREHEEHLRVHQEAITALQNRVADFETKTARHGQTIENLDAMVQRDLGLRYLQLVGVEPSAPRRDAEGGKR